MSEESTSHESTAQGGELIDLNPYPAAVAELEWYFTQSDADQMMSGIDYRSFGSSHGVEDEKRHHRRLCMLRDLQEDIYTPIEAPLGADPQRHRRPDAGIVYRRQGEQWVYGVEEGIHHVGSRRRAVQRSTLVRQRLGSLAPETQHVLVLAFTPRRFDWLDYRSLGGRGHQGPGKYEVFLRKAFRYAPAQLGLDAESGGICLLALALESPSLRAAYLSDPSNRSVVEPGQIGDGLPREPEWPSRVELVRYLQREVNAKSIANTVERARTEAATRLVRALREYDLLIQADRTANAGRRKERAKDLATRLQGGRA